MPILAGTVALLAKGALLKYQTLKQYKNVGKFGSKFASLLNKRRGTGKIGQFLNKNKEAIGGSIMSLLQNRGKRKKPKVTGNITAQKAAFKQQKAIESIIARTGGVAKNSNPLTAERKIVNSLKPSELSINFGDNNPPSTPPVEKPESTYKMFGLTNKWKITGVFTAIGTVVTILIILLVKKNNSSFKRR